MAATLIHVLFEHATGYALFKVKEFEEIAMLLPQVESSVMDLSKFNSIVKLVAFSPFKSGSNALDNINSISEGILHEDLRLFLETNMPVALKKKTAILGVADRKIGDAIMEELGITCQHTGIVPEVIRGLRMHFSKMVKGLTEISAAKAQLGLGHSYSRAKVKFNVNRIDNMIIQSISLLDQLDKDINTFSMRIREWYSYHFPELAKIVGDSHTYAKVTRLVGDRKQMDEEKFEALGQLFDDDVTAQTIVDASKSSMGMDISPIDLINIEMFAGRVVALGDYRKSLQDYLRHKMDQVAPSLACLIGDMIGARLISHAGSLTNLAKYPASTVQILGAEKALFRALKSRGNTPKYGLIFHSSFIGRAALKNKGRISRYLANKCSIASRIDCFADIPTSVYGEHLKQQVEDRLKFYTTGEIPDKNVEVMKRATEEAVVVQAKIAKRFRKKQKLSLAAKSMDLSLVDEELAKEEIITVPNEKKSVKKKHKSGEDLVTGDNEEMIPKKKKRKSDMNEPLVDTTVEEDTPASARKKKKKMKVDEDQATEADDSFGKKTKKEKHMKVNEQDGYGDVENIKTKKRRSMDKSLTEDVVTLDGTSGKKTKKKAKSQSLNDSVEDTVVFDDSSKKKKKESLS